MAKNSGPRKQPGRGKTAKAKIDPKFLNPEWKAARFCRYRPPYNPDVNSSLEIESEVGSGKYFTPLESIERLFIRAWAKDMQQSIKNENIDSSTAAMADMPYDEQCRLNHRFTSEVMPIISVYSRTFAAIKDDRPHLTDNQCARATLDDMTCRLMQGHMTDNRRDEIAMLLIVCGMNIPPAATPASLRRKIAKAQQEYAGRLRMMYDHDDMEDIEPNINQMQLLFFGNVDDSKEHVRALLIANTLAMADGWELKGDLALFKIAPRWKDQWWTPRPKKPKKPIPAFMKNRSWRLPSDKRSPR